MTHADYKLGNTSRRRSAFTLIELVVALSVGVIVSGIAGSLVWSASRIRSEAAARVELTETAAAAMEQVVRHLREIHQDECPGEETPCLNGHAQIDEAAANALRFDETGFRLNGATLQITIDDGASWHIVARDVTLLAFEYFDRLGGAMTSLPLSETDRHAVRRIHATLELSRGTEKAKLRTGIYLRSFLDEVQSDP